MITNKIELNLIQKLNLNVAVFILPVISMGIPYVTGIISYNLYSGFELLAIHLLFAGLAYLIWLINVFFFRKIRITDLEYNSTKNLKTSSLFIILNIIASGTISYAFILLFLHFSYEKEAPAIEIITTCILTILSAVTLGIVYEFYLLQLKWKVLSRNKNEITKVSLQSQIASLEPHFLFNALGTISSLISDEHTEVKRYNQMLANSYSYILYTKNRDAVKLNDELNFTLQYLEMMQYAHPRKIILKNNIEEQHLNQFNIVPVSLQQLVENAIKHNGFTKESPLIITIEKSNANIIVRNHLQEKKNTYPRSGTGLQNLSERCRHLTSKSISIIQTQNEFLVQVPIQPANK